MYHAGLGRFLQTDPMGLQTEGDKLSAGQKALFSPGGVAPDAFTSSEMNLFRYCGNDPVDRSDPFGLVVEASLEYYVIPGSLGGGHMNVVLYDTTTGQTMIARGMPSEKWNPTIAKTLLDQPQKSESGSGNVKLVMDVQPGTKGSDYLTGNKTVSLTGTTVALGDDMKTATAKLKQAAAKITDKRLDYQLRSVNSNSAAATAYSQLTGQNPPQESQQDRFPGSSLNVLTGGHFPAPRPHELEK
jgi:hypothetical protein